VPAGISNNRFPLGCGSDGLQRLGAFKPKLSDVIIRRRSAEGTWPGASDLDLFYLSDGVHHRHVLLVAAIGQVTRDRRRKPFQLAQGAMQAEPRFGAAWIQDDPTGLVSKIAALVL
jgi:hypothetical protein